jgi:hypothetical protein
MRTLRSFVGFFLRLTIVHTVTYVVIGGLSYVLVAKRLWVGPEAVPGLRDPAGEFVSRWMLPAQVLRGFLHALVLYPMRKAFLDMGRWGGLMIAAILIVIGSIAGVAGLIEGIVYTTTTSLSLHLAHLPEVVVQALLFGYLLLWWEKKAGKGSV